MPKLTTETEIAKNLVEILSAKKSVARLSHFLQNSNSKEPAMSPENAKATNDLGFRCNDKLWQEIGTEENILKTLKSIKINFSHRCRLV